MTITDRPVVVGVFPNRDNAVIAVGELKRAGFMDSQIRLTCNTDLSQRPSEHHRGIRGWFDDLFGVNENDQYVGQVQETNWLTDDEWRYYENQLTNDRTLVLVRTMDRAIEASDIMRSSGAYDIETERPSERTFQGATVAAPDMASREGLGASPTDQGITRSMQLNEEELRARKEAEQTGEVVVRKEVVTEHETFQVPVTREEVIIERRPITGAEAASAGPLTDELKPGEEIHIPVSEEHVRVEKVVVPKEEVVIKKRQITNTEEVSGDVRKEELRIEKEGSAKVGGTIDGTTSEPRETMPKGA